MTVFSNVTIANKHILSVQKTRSSNPEAAMLLLV